MEEVGKGCCRERQRRWEGEAEGREGGQKRDNEDWEALAAWGGTDGL